MQKTIATFAVALLFTTIAASQVQAAPTQVNLRIEGRSETLFEGPILTEGHNIRASSDTKAPKSGRRCNGLNNGQNPTPGPTPTATAVGAMALLGEDFDGDWYAEPFEDYFVTRWGPDDQNEALGEYWGIVVNNVFTGVGGCQYKLDGGDEILWTYDAFKNRPRLALYPADYTGGPRLLTATAELGQPFEVDVVAWGSYAEGTPPAQPQRTGSEPFEDAEVGPVTAGPGGYELVDTASPDAVETDADGEATIVFGDSGWHRIKATRIVAGKEVVVRSNRLDVCVPEPAASDCGDPPPDDLARGPWVVIDEGGEIPDPIVTPERGIPNPFSGGPQASGDRRVLVELQRLDRRRLDRRLVGVSWRVLDPGVGLAKWTIASRTLGRKGARYVTRASGRSATSATVRLSPGSAYRLRLTVVDVLGRSSTASLGRVQVPG